MESEGNLATRPQSVSIARNEGRRLNIHWLATTHAEGNVPLGEKVEIVVLIVIIVIVVRLQNNIIER